jgi:hypothetical protein
MAILVSTRVSLYGVLWEKKSAVAKIFVPEKEKKNSVS